MATLNTLKFITAKRTTQLPVAVQRRYKLLMRLEEQLQNARAIAEGKTFSVMRKRKITDDEGVSAYTNVPKKLRTWWWKQENGKIAFSVRYGASVIALNAKGANAIEVANMSELVNALTVVQDAVVAGELDEQIVSAGAKLRAGFKR
jgi:hypothetical protein